MALAHAAPGERIHLPSLAAISGEAKTTALVKTDRFEAVHLVMKSGTRIAPHAVEGYFTLHCLEGAVALGTSGRNITLHGGDWVYLERGERHGLTAAEDSSLLLTILFDGEGPNATQS
jgi:quercetin dioxygenase-like cupin family protein